MLHLHHRGSYLDAEATEDGSGYSSAEVGGRQHADSDRSSVDEAMPALLLESFLRDVPDAAYIHATAGRGAAGMIALVTVHWYDGAEADDWDRSVENLMSYAKRHGYTVIIDRKEPQAADSQDSGGWFWWSWTAPNTTSSSSSSPLAPRKSGRVGQRKMELMSYALRKGYHTAVWKDADVLFMDCDQPIESILARCPHKSGIFFSDVSRTAICSGTFILRNTPYSLKLLNESHQVEPTAPKPLQGDQTAIVFVLLGKPDKYRHNLGPCIDSLCVGAACFEFFPKETEDNICILEHNDFGTISCGQYTEGEFALHFAGTGGKKHEEIRDFSALSTCAEPYTLGKPLHIYSAALNATMARAFSLQKHQANDTLSTGELFCSSTGVTHTSRFPLGIPISLLPVASELEALRALQSEIERTEADKDDVFMLTGPTVWFQKDAADILNTYRTEFPTRPMVLPRWNVTANTPSDCVLARWLFPLFVTAREMVVIWLLIAAITQLQQAAKLCDGDSFRRAVDSLGVRFDDDQRLSCLLQRPTTQVTATLKDANGSSYEPAVVVLDHSTRSLPLPHPQTAEWSRDKLTRFLNVPSATPPHPPLQWERVRYASLCDVEGKYKKRKCVGELGDHPGPTRTLPPTPTQPATTTQPPQR
ncbi:unnamed protein product [Vitrella brassicaformis CCMP3155]|uniref:Nucleotide-diphospho-sugar transferase domain-containing protein n=2 Tax=Vitrella brassicaformis TaxID=1169539 RepID=A0A0G4EE07_VITBC|nr:unnamed protein product [Vitrella brassicaformis CCMP3155]|eukprot:CEL93984.1 unnamed protein product [Vitrella brassicaformis CCMP3155]